MKIIMSTPFRSKSLGNMSDDMVRVVADYTKREYRELEKQLKPEQTEAEYLRRAKSNTKKMLPKIKALLRRKS